MTNIFQYKLPWVKITNDETTMTPLDIFCLKENKYKLNKKSTVTKQLENEIASLLYDVTEKNHTYCGFKPIALAMLTGKLNLMETFLEKDKSIVNDIIPDFGTLLTLLLNPFYNLNLSHKKLNQLLNLLLKENSNPFKIVKISDDKFRGNIYEYCFTLYNSKKYCIHFLYLEKIL